MYMWEKFPQRCGVTKKVKTCFNPNDCEKELFFFKLRTKCTCGKKFPQRCGVTKKVKACFNPNDCEKEFF